MKLLAISDIHNNLPSVRKLRDHVANDFDAVVVAGDIGNKCAKAFFEILTSFECPVLYVYGNWDTELPYDNRFAGAQLLHHNAIEIGGYVFTGFSSCPTRWGRNPIAEKLGDGADASRILKLNRDGLMRIAKMHDPLRTIVVTHERLTKLKDSVPNALLHLYGHLHGFNERTSGKTRLVNVSVLDRQLTVQPDSSDAGDVGDYRNVNAGTFTIIELNRENIGVRSVELPHDYHGWKSVSGRRYNGLMLVPAEQKWTTLTDPLVTRYSVG